MKLRLYGLVVLMLVLRLFVNGQDIALENGLRLHLNFNANLADQSGAVADGILKGASYGMDRFGNCEFALCFREFLELAEMDPAAVTGLQDFSLSLWFRKDETSFGTLLSVSNPSRDNELNLNIGATGLLSSNIRNLSNVRGIAIVGTTDVNDGDWHHVVLTRDGTSGDTYLYVDKQEDNFKVMPLGVIEVSTSAFVLGNDQDCVSGCYDPGQQFFGALDDFRIYDRIINQDEINALFDFADGEVDNKIRGTSKDLATCADQVILEIDRDFDSFVWSTGSTQRSIEVTEDGQYIVTGMIKDCEFKDTVNVVMNTLPALMISSDETQLACFGNIVIEASPGFDEYIWQDGSRGETYEVTNTGVYQVRGISVCGEVVSNSIEIIQSPLFPLEVTAEATSVGCGETLILTGIEGFSNYRWSDGQEGREIEVASSGTYELTAVDICGEIVNANFTVEPRVLDPYFIPNTFTPNGDGKNEQFEIDSRLLNYSLIIVNRWGERIYQNESYQNDWDGNTIKSGVYYYIISGPCLEQAVKGWVKIVR